MVIDPSISLVPFASLDNHSFFQESEKEILFSMHTVFRIGDMKPLDKDKTPRLWHVRLALTKADDEQLRQLTEYMRLDLRSVMAPGYEINMDPTWRLSKLFMNMGDYDKAYTIYEMMLDKATRENDSKLAQAVHYQLAELFAIYKTDWEQARKHIKQMFCLGMPDDSDVDNDARGEFAMVFSAIRDLLASEQINEEECHQIMADLLHKMVTLYLDHSVKPLSPFEYQLIVDRYNYIGFVRKKQGKLSEAKACHKRALQILREHLPSTHPRLAVTYNYMSSIYSTMNNYSRALEYLKEALKIQEKALQPNHPHIVETHFLMSIHFEQLNKLDKALKHAKKAVAIAHQVFKASGDSNMKKYQEQFDKILALTQSCDELVL
ncbi:unnamed protein product [Rotaria sp. Silwood2]|nr:unnamed protein product [Rotaria sp. Silwood2]CAF2958868.1 unnamed protein product [Rotaria sp. Silwood2]CAF3261604.1 unnamed protein product [Rotaria sp. Silwood2]CAF3325875.1 unnamed protein product [Rotaria sp. Silwood2]CAF4162186.1 unnamed protein product [Rotaria sp. Silwood2]